MLLIGLRNGGRVGDVDEAAGEADDFPVPLYRNLGGDDLPDLASDEAFAERA